MVINNDFNKVQVNRTLDRDAQGNVIRQSLMVNIRTDNVKEAVTLYQELKDRLNGNVASAQITNNKTNESIPLCKNCGKQMIIRKNKKGESFWGCSGYPNCKFTLPYNVNANKQEIQVEEIPF